MPPNNDEPLAGFPNKDPELGAYYFLPPKLEPSSPPGVGVVVPIPPNVILGASYVDPGGLVGAKLPKSPPYFLSEVFNWVLAAPEKRPPVLVEPNNPPVGAPNNDPPAGLLSPPVTVLPKSEGVGLLFCF